MSGRARERGGVSCGRVPGGGEQGGAVIRPQGRRARCSNIAIYRLTSVFLFQEQVSGHAVNALLTRFLTGFPATDDAVLLTSELCGNAVTHSASGRPGGFFTLRARAPGITHLLVEVEDKGRLVCRRSGRC